MNKYLSLALLLGVPLILLIIVALSVYGLDGPPDDASSNAVSTRVGIGYGVYTVAAFLLWRRKH